MGAARTRPPRNELAKAEQLSPGLSFAKPEAVSALRGEISALSGAPRAGERSAGARSMGAAPGDARPQGSAAISLASLLLLRPRFIGLFMFLRRRRRPQPPMGPTGPMAGPNDFGRYPQQPGYPPRRPGQYPAGYPPSVEGMGSSIGHGLATASPSAPVQPWPAKSVARMFDHNGNEIPKTGGEQRQRASQLARDAGLGGYAEIRRSTPTWAARISASRTAAAGTA